MLLCWVFQWMCCQVCSCGLVKSNILSVVTSTPHRYTVCAHVQCGWDVDFCTDLWGGSCELCSQLTCVTWFLEWNIVLTLSLLTQHIVYQLCWWVVHVSDQSCFFMQDGVRKRGVKFTEVEQTLSGMGRLETLVLGISRCVSLRWYNIVVTNCTSALVQGM